MAFGEFNKKINGKILTTKPLTAEEQEKRLRSRRFFAQKEIEQKQKGFMGKWLK